MRTRNGRVRHRPARWAPVLGWLLAGALAGGVSTAGAQTGRIVVERSGDADLGKWMTETRNVSEDYKRIYGEEPKEAVGAVSISINSQNTGSRAESYFGEILFRKP